MNDPCDSSSTDNTPAPLRRAAHGLRIETVSEAGDWTTFGSLDEAVEAVAEAVWKELSNQIGTAEVALALSDDARVSALNASFRGKAQPTNVLSFPNPGWAPQSMNGPAFLGDIALAYETVCREADAQDKLRRDHFQHLLVHGILHLCGYDHIAESEACEMEDREVSILARLGIGDPYAVHRTDGLEPEQGVGDLIDKEAAGQRPRHECET